MTKQPSIPGSTFPTQANFTNNSSRRSRGFTALLIALLAGVGLLLAGCGGSNNAGEVANPANLQASAVQVEGSGDNLVAKFPVPSTAENLSTNDLKVGTGPKAAIGSTVNTKYWLFGGSTGTKIDSSSTGVPMQLTQGGLIQGFLDGMVGIQAGGERVIVVPGKLGYGENPPPGSNIAKNETLVFVVQAISVS